MPTDTSSGDDLKVAFDKLIAQLDDILDEEAPSAGELAATRAAKVWLENLLDSLESWAVDIGVDRGTLKTIRDSALGTHLRMCFEDIEAQITEWSSLVEEFAKNTTQNVDSHQSTSPDTVQKHVLASRALFSLQDSVESVRSFLATEHETGPYRSLKAQIARVRDAHLTGQVSEGHSDQIMSTGQAENLKEIIAGISDEDEVLDQSATSTAPPLSPKHKQYAKMDVRQEVVDTMGQMGVDKDAHGQASNVGVVSTVVERGTVPALMLTSAFSDYFYSISSSSGFSSEDELEDIALILENRRPILNQTSYAVERDVADVANIFPLQIACSLTVKFNGVTFENNYSFSHFQWYKEESYDLINTRCLVVIANIKKQRNDNDRSINDHNIYLRHGSCSVVGTTAEGRHSPDLSTFTETNMSQKAIRAICQFISVYPCERFELQLSCDYGSMIVTPKSGWTFRDSMRIQYVEMLKVNQKNILKQSYISNADINALTSVDVSNRLIDEDHTLTEEEKEELKREMHNRVAQTLLAVCVHAEMPMRMFQHFLLDEHHGYSDRLLPHSGEQNGCRNMECRVIWQERLIENMHKFFAHKVVNDHWFHERKPEEIVPISFVPNGNSYQGGYSWVHEVYIDPTHREGELSASESTRKYALKVFDKGFGHRSEQRDHFRKEIRMLLYLAVYPHPHILTHITSWEQNETFYILYDKADHNLRTFMHETEGADLGKKKVLWFFDQLRGLADAIRKVHQLREPTARLISPLLMKKDTNSSRKPKKNKKTSIIGYHHDIKPENILCFSRPSQLPILKLSDFGAGKLFSVAGKRSGKASSKAHGTLTYFGPEFDVEMNRPMTRPFDMWALGCVFLELLQWFLGMEGNILGKGKSFASYRLELTNFPTGEQFDFFWYKPDRQHRKPNDDIAKVPGLPCALNPRVKDLLDLLENEYCKSMPAFLDLIAIIRELLEIDSRDRLKAPVLASKLDAILSQAVVDLAGGPNTYSVLFTRNLNVITSFDRGYHKRVHAISTFSSPSLVIGSPSQLPRGITMNATELLPQQLKDPTTIAKTSPIEQASGKEPNPSQEQDSAHVSMQAATRQLFPNLATVSATPMYPARLSPLDRWYGSDSETLASETTHGPVAMAKKLARSSKQHGAPREERKGSKQNSSSASYMRPTKAWENRSGTYRRSDTKVSGSHRPSDTKVSGTYRRPDTKVSGSQRR